MDFSLKNGQVHTWTVDLEACASLYAPLWQLLSEHEQARARRFAFPYLRERYVISHGFVRALLAAYLQTADLKFAIGVHGKPCLIDQALKFNLSHSHLCACVAFSYVEVGVDVEHIQPELPVVEGVFSNSEMEMFLAIPEGLRVQSFYEAWTRKEAYLKALGVGLMQSMDEAEVGFDAPPNWTFSHLTFAGPYAGCVALPKENLLHLARVLSYASLAELCRSAQRGLQ